MSANLATGNARAPLRDRREDLYETPECAVEALLGVEKLPSLIWEPACGPGAIVRVLRTYGHRVIATDLVDYGLEHSESRIDFLMEQQAPTDVRMVLTNPPFKIGQQFVEHALRLCPSVIMLLRLAFLESARRSFILENCGLARVHIFRERLPMMHRHSWEGRRASSSMPFAWFVWDRHHEGPPTLHRISTTTGSLQ
jgi:hypothetical protein